MIHHEFDVQAHLRCPMFDEAPGVGGALGCSLRLLRWAVLEAFNGRLADVTVLRRKFVFLWGESGDVVKDSAYYAGIRLGNSAAKRIYLFLQNYEVLHPMQWYELTHEGEQVTGEYAVVKKRLRSETYPLPMILVAHDRNPTRRGFVSAVEIFRYLHLMLNTDYVDAGVYHLPLRKGRPWMQGNFELPLVREAAYTILGAVRYSGFPIPGSHCAECVSKSCRSIARG